MLDRIERALRDRRSPTTNALFWASSFFFAIFIALAAPVAHADSEVKRIDVGSPPTGVAITPDGQEIWVSHWDGGSTPVDVFATATNASHAAYSKVSGLYGMTGNWEAIAINPDGRQAYPYTLGILDTSATATNGIYPPYTSLGSAFEWSDYNANDGNSVFHLTYGKSWTGMAVTSDGYIYAAMPGGSVSGVDNRVVVFLTGSGAAMACCNAITVGNNPRGVAASKDGRYVYVANHDSDTVSKIATLSSANPVASQNTVAGTATVGNNPWGIAVAPDGLHAYVANYGSNNVSVIDTNAMTSTLINNTGIHPTGVAVTPDGGYLLVTNCGANCSDSEPSTETDTMSVISTTSNTVVGTIAVGVNPVAVTISKDGRYAYVANYGSYANVFLGWRLDNASISVISLDTPATLTTTGVPTNATVGEPFTLPGGNPVVMATGGNPIPTLAVTSGSLPPGLSLVEFTTTIGGMTYRTGAYFLQGTPTTAGSYSFTVTASNNAHGDPNAATDYRNFTIVVGNAPVAPAITTASLPDATAGVLYTQAIAASGSPAPEFSYSDSGPTATHPGWLSLDSATGELSGTPPVAAAGNTYTFTIRAENSAGYDEKEYTLTVNAAPGAPAITTTSLPSATAGQLYRQCRVLNPITGACASYQTIAIAVTGSPTPACELALGDALPAGLTLNADCTITGTPTPTAVTTTFTVIASNTAGTDSRQYTLTVGDGATAPSLPALAMLPGAVENQLYVNATGGNIVIAVSGSPAPNCTLTATSNPLPTGLTLNPNCSVTGTPAAGTAGTYGFDVAATNSAGTATGHFSIVVSAAPVPVAITTPSLPDATLNQPYSETVATTGTAPIVFTQPGGTLPQGLSLNPSTGEIAGTPTKAGTFTFTIAATNTVGGSPVTATRNYTIVVIDPNAPPVPTSSGEPASVPTLDGAALALLALLLAGGAAGARALRRRY